MTDPTPPAPSEMFPTPTTEWWVYDLDDASDHFAIAPPRAGDDPGTEYGAGGSVDPAPDAVSLTKKMLDDLPDLTPAMGLEFQREATHD